MSEMKDKIEDMTTINFSITKCPLKVFKGFSEFCKSETNDNYAFGLKMLLESRKANIKEVVLFEQYAALRDELAVMKGKLEQKEEKTKPKTMGAKNLEVKKDE